MDDAVVTYWNNYNNKLKDPNTGYSLPSENGTSSRIFNTGDGIGGGGTACPWTWNTKWNILSHPDYGKQISQYISGVGLTQCGISQSDMSNYVEEVATKMAIDHAQELKDKGIKVYTVGLGANTATHKATLAAIATGPAFAYYDSSAANLTEMFHAIATNIKLRLIQ